MLTLLSFKALELLIAERELRLPERKQDNFHKISEYLRGGGCGQCPSLTLFFQEQRVMQTRPTAL